MILMEKCEENSEECRVLPCPCMKNEAVFKFIPLDRILETKIQEIDQILSYEKIIIYNIELFRKLLVLPFAEFWSTVIYPTKSEWSLYTFLLTSSFKRQCEGVNNVQETLKNLVYKVCERLYNPSGEIDQLSDAKASRYKVWVAEEWPKLSLDCGITSMGVLINVSIEVLYTDTKYIRNIRKTLKSFFSSSDKFVEIFREAFSIFGELLKQFNDTFNVTRIEEVINNELNNKNATGNPYHVIMPLKKYAVSESMISCLSSAACTFGILFTLLPHLTETVFDFNSRFLLNLSIAYRVINQNIFSNLEQYKNPYNYKKIYTDLKNNLENLLFSSLSEVEHGKKNLSVNKCNTTLYLLLELKTSILKLVEICVWLNYDNGLFDCFKRDHPYNLLPETIIKCLQKPLTANCYNLSTIEINNTLMRFSSIFTNVELKDKTITANGNCDYEYVQFLNSPLISDLSCRLNLLPRIDTVCKIHMQNNCAYYVTYMMNVLNDYIRCTRELTVKQHNLVKSEPQTPSTSITSRILKQIPFYDTYLTNLILEVFDNDPSQSVLFAMDLSKQIEALTEEEILISVSNIIYSKPQKTTLNMAMSKNPSSRDQIEKTLMLDEKIYQNELALEKARDEYNTLISSSPLLSSNVNTLEKYYLEDSTVFSKTSRRSRLRNNLRTQTGLDDNQIEGWYSMYVRIFGKDAMPAEKSSVNPKHAKNIGSSENISASTSLGNKRNRTRNHTETLSHPASDPVCNTKLPNKTSYASNSKHEPSKWSKKDVNLSSKGSSSPKGPAPSKCSSSSKNPALSKSPASSKGSAPSKGPAPSKKMSNSTSKSKLNSIPKKQKNP